MPCRLSRSLRPRPSGECVLEVGCRVEQARDGLRMEFGSMDMFRIIVMVLVGMVASEDDFLLPALVEMGF